MSLSSQATRQKFPFPYDDVFDGLVVVIPYLGMSLKTQDRVIGRISASAGMSLFSWGENLTFVIEKLDKENTVLSIESALKLGANLNGSHRHQKNFNDVISKLSEYLQTSDHVEEDTVDFTAQDDVTAESNSNQGASNGTIGIIIGVVLLYFLVLSLFMH